MELTVVQVAAAIIAFGPPVAASIVVSQKAHLLVCALACALVWLVSMILAAAVLAMVPASPILVVVWVTVGAQEAGRFAFVALYQRVASQLGEMVLDDRSSSLAAGIGFATIHTLVVFGTVSASECVLAGATVALLFSVLDVTWTCLAFARRDSLAPPAVFGFHLAATASTVLDAPCGASLPLIILVLFLSTALLWRSPPRSRSTSEAMMLRPLRVPPPTHPLPRDENSEEEDFAPP